MRDAYVEGLSYDQLAAKYVLHIRPTDQHRAHPAAPRGVIELRQSGAGLTLVQHRCAE